MKSTPQMFRTDCSSAASAHGELLGAHRLAGGAPLRPLRRRDHEEAHRARERPPPARGRAHLPGSSGLFTRSHPGFCAETIGPPGSLGSPLARMPRSSTAAGRDDARHCATSPAAFRFLDSVGLRTPLLTRLNHAACVLPVYASQRRPPQGGRHYATLGSHCWLGFAGRV